MTMQGGLSTDTYNQLCEEYMDWLVTQVSDLGELVEKLPHSDEPDKILVQLLREAHNLKGASSSFGFTTISIVAHRFEDYLNEAHKSSEKRDIVADLTSFLDQMRALGEIAVEPREEVSATMLRHLPVFSAHVEEAKLSDVHIDALIVSPSNTVASIARMVMENNGIQTSVTRVSTEGLMLAIKTKPDIVMFSLEMDTLSGIDLALAIRAMGQTQNTILVLITSASKDHPEILRLPKDINIVFESSGLVPDLSRIAEACINKQQK